MKKRFFLVSAVALLLMAACNDDKYGGSDVEGSLLIVSAGIDEVKTTRVSEAGTEWEVGDSIGVSDSSTNLNIAYAATATTGTFTSDTGIYILGGDEVTYTAYYPFSGTEGTTVGDIDFSVLDSNGDYDATGLDFMYATGTATRSNPQVDFSFQHMMSRLRLTITDSASNGTAITYVLGNVVVDGTFNTESGVVTPGSTTGSITVDATLGTASYVMLPPVASASTIQITIYVGNSVYVGTFAPALAASTEYQYTIELGDTEEGKTVTVSSESITGWTGEDGGSISVKEEVTYNATLEIGDYYCSDGTIIDKTYDLTSLDSDVKASIVGVIYYLGDVTAEDAALKADYPSCTNGLVVALNNANASSSTFATTSGGLYDWYKANSSSYSNYVTTQYSGSNISSTTKVGYNNTQVFVTAAATDADSYAGKCDNLISYLNAYKESASVASSGSSNWYLPSWAELDLLRTNLSAYEAIATSIANMGGSLTTYSDFLNASPADNFYWSSTERAANLIWVSPLSESTETLQARRTGHNGWFRFILAF